MATGCITWPTAVRHPRFLMNIVLMMIAIFPNVIVRLFLLIPATVLIKAIPEKLMRIPAIRIVTTCGLPAAIPLVRQDLRPLTRADVRIHMGITAAVKPVTAPIRNAAILNPTKLAVPAAQRPAATAAAAHVFAVRHVLSRKNQTQNRNRSRHRLLIRIQFFLKNQKTAIPAPVLPAQPGKAVQSAKLIPPAPVVQWFVPNVTIQIPVPDKAARPAWPAARKAVLPTAPKQIAARQFAPNATK